jgi:hypothetical protein
MLPVEYSIPLVRPTQKLTTAEAWLPEGVSEATTVPSTESERVVPSKAAEM